MLVLWSNGGKVEAVPFAVGEFDKLKSVLQGIGTNKYCLCQILFYVTNLR